jgi:hypothetical protein
MRTRFAWAAAAFAVITVIASGCGSSSDLEPAPAATADNAAPAETPTPAPSPTPFVPDCTNIIDADTIATLEAEGFVLIEEHEHKVRVEERVETLFFDNGGVDCLWGIAGGGDSLVAFGYSEITPAAAEAAQAQLQDAGYVATTQGTDIVLSIAPEVDVMGVGDVFVFSDGSWFHATTPEAVLRIRETVAQAQG